jgi:regulator of sigma E protease
MSTTIIFLLVLTALVFIHELGHFLAARLFKIRVDEFAIGFPPRLFSWIWGKTRYAINLLPLGGYVKIYGENAEDEQTPDSMLSKPRWQQAVVLIAGVTFNILFAWILLSCALMIGTKVSSDALPAHMVKNPELTITMTAPGAPAERAGLKAGDRILKVSGLATDRPEQVQEIIAGADQSLTFTIQRSTGETEQIEVTPEDGIVSGKKAIGISMDTIAEARAGFFSAFYYGAKQTYHLTINVTLGLADFFKNLFMGNASLKQVSGPVGIAGVVGESARMGFAQLLLISAVISVNLAVINLAPFPALDGGRLVIVAIEGVIRRRVNPKFQLWLNAIGFLLLITLMIVVTVKDVVVLVN